MSPRRQTAATFGLAIAMALVIYVIGSWSALTDPDGPRWESLAFFAVLAAVALVIGAVVTTQLQRYAEKFRSESREPSRAITIAAYACLILGFGLWMLTRSIGDLPLHNALRTAALPLIVVGVLLQCFLLGAKPKPADKL